MNDNEHETYSRLELDMLIDAVIMHMRPDGGFMQYSIRGIYVSPEVVEQVLNERLEKMAR